MRSLLLALAVLLPLPLQAMPPGCNAGVVYEDSNGNGRRDRGERPLPGVRVSDGRRIVATDASGRYALPVESGRTTFVVKPAGYRLPRREDGLPDGWTNIQPDPGPALKYGGVPVRFPDCRDFALVPETGKNDWAAREKPLQVLVFGDPQPKSLVDVDYYRRDIVEPLGRDHGADLGISLGDIVDDDLSLFPAVKAVDATLATPWLHVPGNHDIDFDAPDDARSLDSFRHAFGPDTRAWEEHQANFIVLDDVLYQPGGKPEYIGGLREEQFEFLEAYLGGADRSRLLVLALHIPLFDTGTGGETFRKADRERLFALLKDFPRRLVLSSHTHRQRHHYHDAVGGWQGATPLHEYNVGAACGGFWTGVKDAAGIPLATMADGTPNGYARLDVDAKGYRLRWFNARAPESEQITLHSPGVLRRGAYPAFAVYANYHMGEADSRVEYRIDGGEWKPMRRVSQPDPLLLAENALDNAAPGLRGYDRSPEATASSHLWRGALPTDLAAGEHEVEVRAFDRWRGEVGARTSYRLETAEP